MKPLVLGLALAAVASGQQSSPLSPAFEVASIKLAPPNTGPGSGIVAKLSQDLIQSQMKLGFIPMDRARVTIRNYSLLNLIAAAYRVRTRQISGPAWLAELRFDVDAKIPEGAPPGQANEMLQALLAERFALRLHKQSISQAGYALLVGKNGPKLQAATPLAGALDSADVSDDQKQETQKKMKEKLAQMRKERQDHGGIEGRFSQFDSVTTAELADALSSYVDGPVRDMTGLDGTYEASLRTSQPHLDPSTGLENPGITIFESVAKLGLKLEVRKVLVDTLVVDNVSKMPTEN